MKPIRCCLFQLLALLLFLGSARIAAAPPEASASYHYYVASNGSDANPGTEALPFETILRASRLALPGTIIHVAPGTYPGGFKTSISGNAAQRIVYVSSQRWGARLVPPAHSTSGSAWDNRGSFVDIDGFDIDGAPSHAGTKWTYGIYASGSHTVVRNNHVHHLAQQSACTSAGGAGIAIDSYYRGDQNTVTGNTVHDVGPPGCRFVQGIYISTSGGASNNVVYRIGGSAIQTWHDAHHVVVSNNTVSASLTGILIGGGDNYHTRGPNDYSAVHNNIVYDNSYGISEQGTTGPHNSYRNNLVYQNRLSDWQLRNGLAHTGTVAQAPQFLRYSRVGLPDFRLAAHSPAVGTGTDEHAAGLDITGKARSKEQGIDIGAHQR